MLKFVALILTVLPGQLIAQEQPDSVLSDKVAYLYFYRSKRFLGSGNGIGIMINNNEIHKIKNGTRLIVEYSQLNQPIILTCSNKINDATEHSTMEIMPERGKAIYIEVKWGSSYDKENQVQIIGSQKTRIAIGLPEFSIYFTIKDNKDGEDEFNNSGLYKKESGIKRIKI